MARSFLFFALLLAAVASVWLLWPGGESDSDAPADTSQLDDDAPTLPDAPLLRGPSEGASSVPLELRGRGTIVGRVSLDGAPVTAAVVLYHLESFTGADPLGVWRGRSFVDRLFDGGVATGEALADVRAADDGTFSFEGLRTGRYELRATSAAGQSARTAAAIPAAGARAEALLDLTSSGETLRGRVVHAGGASVRGQVIVERGENMSPFFGPSPGAAVCSVGDDGTFVIGGLPQGPAAVSFLQPGTLRLFGAAVVLPRTEEFVITIGAGSETMRGRVLDDADDSPIQGAGVTAGAGSPGTGILLLRTTTDADGRFEVALPPGEGGLFVQADGYAPHTGEWTGAGTEMDIRLLRTARLTGRVIRAEDKEAVSDVWVFALPMERGFGLAFPVAGRTNAAGRFDLPDVAPGEVTLFAMGNGWVSPGLGEAQADGYNPFARSLAPAASEEVELEVVAAGRFTGRVASADGKGIAGAILTVETSFFAMRRMSAMAIFGGGVGSTVTDADGSFVVDTVVPDVDATIKVQAVGHPPWASDALRVGIAETKHVDVTLDAPRWILLTVSASDGPVAGATIRIGVRDGPEDWSRAPGMWTTDGKGRARVGPLPAGIVGVKIESPEHIHWGDFDETPMDAEYEEMLSEDARGETAATIKLRKGLVLAGIVRAPESVPVAGVSVSVSGRTAGRGYVWRNPPVAADGTWRQGGLGDATYEVEARLKWKGRTYTGKVDAAAGDLNVEVTLEAPEEKEGALIVKIVDPDGHPVARGRVRVHSRTGGSRRSSGSDFSNGEASFDRDFADAEQVWIEVYGIAGGRWGEVVVGPLAGASGEIEVRVPPARTIAGIVLAPDGKGVGGIRVTAARMDPNDDDWSNQGASALSGTDGRFEVRGLGDRPYQIRIKAASIYAPMEPHEVRGGAQDVRIDLMEAARADVKVLDWRGEPVAGAVVSVVTSEDDEDPRDWRRTKRVPANASGIARLGGLTPGIAYDLSVEAPGPRDDLKPESLRGWKPEDITIRLGRAYVISGIVRDTAGAPLSDATVQWATVADPTSWRGVGCEDDGTFRIGGLDAGLILLRPGLPSGPWRPGMTEEPVQSVQAGTDGVVLRLDAGLTLTVKLEGWPSDAWGDASLHLEGDGGGEVGSEHVQPGERIRFYRLKAGRTYTLWVVNWDSSFYVIERGLSPGAGERKVRAKRGVEITGQLLLPAGASARRYSASIELHGKTFGIHVSDDGTFSKEGLPPGTWTVKARASGTGVSWRGSGTVEAPGSVTIQLE